MRSRFRTRRGGIAALAVILGAAIGVPIVVKQVTGGGSTPPAPGLANVWTSTGGSDAGASCVWHPVPILFSANGGPGCATLDKEFQLATGTGTAGVEAGNYPSNLVIGQNAAVTGYVTYVPDGGTVNFQGLVCVGSASSACVAAKSSPSWVKLDALASPGSTFVYQKGWSVQYRTQQPQHIFFNGGHSSPGGYDSVNDLTVQNMEIGPYCCDSDGVHSGWKTGQPQITNVRFIGNYIHGLTNNCATYVGQSPDGVGPATCGPDTAVHVDCFQLDTGQNIDIIRNRCFDNWEQGIFFGGTAGGGPASTSCPTASTGCYEGTINIEGNAVSASVVTTPFSANPFILGRNVAPPAAAQPSWSPSAVVNVRYNSIPSNYLFNNNTAADRPGTIHFVGNIGAGPSDPNGTASSCTDIATTVTYSHNFFSNRTCGPTDTSIGGFPYVSNSTTTPDFHLVPGSPELLGGDPADCPSLDIDGQVRTALVCDAGADQVSSVGSSTGTGGTGLASGFSTATPLAEGGFTRYFKTYKPATACPSSGCPLVVMLGGSVSSTCAAKTSYLLMTDCDIGTSATSGTGQVATSNWPAAADAHGLIIVEPEMGAQTCLNGGGCGSPEPSPNGAFVGDVISYVKSHANIDPGKVWLFGFSAGASQVLAIANGENGLASPAAKFTFSDWSTASSLFNEYGVLAGALGGDAPTEAAVNTPVFAAVARPTIYVTSKNDPTITADDSEITRAFSPCALKTATTCQLRASTVNGYYATRYGCTGPTKTTITEGSFTSNDRWDFTCPAPAAYQWWSMGSSSSNGPLHSYASENTAHDIPTLMWTFWSAH